MNKQTAFSFIALLLSIIACIITWLRIDVTITNDTFIGIMAGFMGICTTILVGAQIYNQIENKKQIEYTKKLQDDLNRDLKNSKIQWTKSEKRIEALIQYTHGLALHYENPIISFEYLYSALKEGLLYCTSDEINHILHDIKVTSIKIEKEYADSSKKKKIAYTIPPGDINPETLSQYPNYALIKKDYSEAYQRYYNVVSKCKIYKIYDI